MRPVSLLAFFACQLTGALAADGQTGTDRRGKDVFSSPAASSSPAVTPMDPNTATRIIIINGNPQQVNVNQCQAACVSVSQFLFTGSQCSTLATGNVDKVGDIAVSAKTLQCACSTEVLAAARFCLACAGPFGIGGFASSCTSIVTSCQSSPESSATLTVSVSVTLPPVTVTPLPSLVTATLTATATATYVSTTTQINHPPPPTLSTTTSTSTITMPTPTPTSSTTSTPTPTSTTTTTPDLPRATANAARREQVLGSRNHISAAIGLSFVALVAGLGIVW